RIRKKAVERAVITAEQATRITEWEVFNLIFLPGFSRAEKVTNVSGRGVGTDVVKTNVEKIGGTVDIQSTLGQGTTIRVKMPLTLAIIPALVVTCGGDRYAIPQVSLLELVRIEAAKVAKSIELVHGAPVYRLRGRLLPLVYLDRELKFAADANLALANNGAVNIVVLQADERQFGLVVDQHTWPAFSMTSASWSTARHFPRTSHSPWIALARREFRWTRRNMPPWDSPTAPPGRRGPKNGNCRTTSST